MRKLVRSSIAMPEELLQWLSREAEASGRSRNSLVTYLLEQARDTQVIARLERIERILKLH